MYMHQRIRQYVLYNCSNIHESIHLFAVCHVVCPHSIVWNWLVETFAHAAGYNVYTYITELHRIPNQREFRQGKFMV